MHALAPYVVVAAMLAPSEDAAASRIVLVSSASLQDNEELASRLRRTRAELEAAGFDVLDLAMTGGGLARAKIVEIADEEDAQAIAVFDPQRVRVEFWARDTGGAVTRRALIVGETGVGSTDAVFALRVAEVAIEFREKLEMPPEPKPEPEPEASPPATPPQIQPGRWAARAGLNVLGSVDDVGVMLGPTLGGAVALGPRRRLTLDLEATVTARRGAVTTESIDAKLGLAAVRTHIGWWSRREARLSAGAGLGIGALIGWTAVVAHAPYVARANTTAVALPSAAGDVALRITPSFRLRLGIRVGVALPAIRVRTPERTVSPARPLIDGGFALEVVPPKKVRRSPGRG